MRGVCPFCKSATTQQASAIHAAGTGYSDQTISVTGYDPRGLPTTCTGYGGGVTPTNLAARCAPPRRSRGLIRLFLLSFFAASVLGAVAWLVLAVVYQQQ